MASSWSVVRQSSTWTNTDADANATGIVSSASVLAADFCFLSNLEQRIRLMRMSSDGGGNKTLSAASMEINQRVKVHHHHRRGRNRQLPKQR